MKTIIAMSLVVAANLSTLQTIHADEAQQIDNTAQTVKAIVDAIGDAQKVVICSFKLPEGARVSAVLFGNRSRLGELWDSVMFPKQPILVYERINDYQGTGSSILMETGYFELDKTNKFVIIRPADDEAAISPEILVPLEAIKQTLTNKKKKQRKPEIAPPSQPSE